MQAALLDSLYGTERGLTARSEVRAEINELISQLEAKNPNPSPTDVSIRQLDMAYEASVRCAASLPESVGAACLCKPV